MRGELRTRSVVFGSADVELDLEVRYEADSVVLLGQITPAGEVTVEVQASDGATDEVAVDDLGRFPRGAPGAARDPACGSFPPAAVRSNQLARALNPDV